MRTLAEYRQAIALGLERLDSDDLASLIVRHFPELDHTRNTPQSCNAILAAPRRVLAIWNEVNAFLAQRKLAPLAGEPPPEDLDNRAGRSALSEELQSFSIRTTRPEVSSDSLEISYHSDPASARSYSEPTLEQPIPKSRTAAYRARASSQTSRHILIGFLVVWFSMVTLVAIHICPSIKHVVQAKPEPLVSLNTQPQTAPTAELSESLVTLRLAPLEVPDEPEPAPAPLAVLDEPEPAPAPLAIAATATGATPADETMRPRRHRGRDAAGPDRFDFDSGHDCQFAVPSAESGPPSARTVITKIQLPQSLTPGSREARDWLQSKCRHIRRETLHHG